MMIHQDGSTHEWVEGRKWDLIVTTDDATNEHYSMFFVDEEGTLSSLRGVREVIEARGLLSLYASSKLCTLVQGFSCYTVMISFPGERTKARRAYCKHSHVEYPAKVSVSDFVKRVKGRTSRLLEREYPELKKRYWGKHFWAIGYGAWSTGNVTDEMVQEYLEHHRHPSNRDTGNIILE